MLTGKLVRVRFAKDRVLPTYLDISDPQWPPWAERLLGLFGAQLGRTRGELAADVDECLAGLPNALVQQGLAKLLEDRCDFEVESAHPPDELRQAVFSAATQRRQQPGPFQRDQALADAAAALSLEPAAIERGLFADLKSEQRLVRFDDITPTRLLERYNVALAQALLLRAVGIEVLVRRATPQRFRQLFRQVKFHRLVCEAESAGPQAYRLRLDGPLSLFSATQKYGLQLALFLPALLLCADFELEAKLRWGPERKEKRFTLSSSDGLVSHHVDTGTYVPAEVRMFAELFRKKIKDWVLHDEPDIVPLESGFWVPDFRLEHPATGRSLGLEILGFWRRSGVEKHLARLRALRQPFLIAVSEQLHVADEELQELPAGVVRFRQMPVPDEVVRQAEAIL